MEEGRNAFKIREDPTGKRPLERPSYRCKDNTRTDLKEICANTRNWIDSTQGRDSWRVLVNTLKLRVPRAKELFSFYDLFTLHPSLFLYSNNNNNNNVNI